MEKIQYLLKWSSLKKMQEQRIVQSTYIWLFILPIAAKLLEQIDSEVKLHLADSIIKFNFELPFSWKLFFISALLFTVANILYIVFCPLIIKENKHLGEFLSNSKDEGHLEEYMTASNQKEWKRAFLELGGEINKLERIVQKGGLGVALPLDRFEKEQYRAEKIKDMMRSFFWKIYNEEDKNLYFIRWVCGFIYSIAMIMFSYIIIKNIIYTIHVF